MSNIVIQLVNLFHSLNTPIYKCMALYLFPKESFISGFHIWWIFIFCDVIETDWFIPSTLNCLNRLSSVIMNCTSNPSRLFTWEVRIWMILQFTFMLSFCGSHFILKIKMMIYWYRLADILIYCYLSTLLNPELANNYIMNCCGHSIPVIMLTIVVELDLKDEKGYDKSVTLKINKPVYCPGELQIGICHGI